MWHEARKHEKKIRGIMIDHRRRAEKRREFYESIRRDPASYLQIHGQQMKIHIDPIVSQAAESSLVPWMSDKNNLIDRFDVRANLDSIPSVDTNDNDDGILTSDQECQLNYERYRNLVQNDFVENNEQKVLHRIFLKEKWGEHQTNNAKTKSELKKKLSEKKTAIGYNYDENDSKPSENLDETSSESDDDLDHEEFEDLDIIVDISQLDKEMCERINMVAKKYGIKPGAFTKFMLADKAEADRLRIAKEIENEKSMFVGRKSRRERKVLIQQRLLILRSINTDNCEVDHFATESKPQKNNSDDSSDENDDDDSKSEIEEGKIEFITSFGNEDEETVNDSKSSKINQNKMKKESNKKHSNKKKSKRTADRQSNNTYGPSFPANFSKSNTHFNANRFRKFSDDEKFSSDRSPSYNVRRSPSVRRRVSSSDDGHASSSDDSFDYRHRSYRRKHSSSPERYRRQYRSHSRKRMKSRSKSPQNHRRHRTYRNRSESKSPEIKSNNRLSPLHNKERKSQKTKISDSSNNAEKGVEKNDENMKLYKLLEKIETNARKNRNENEKSTNSSENNTILVEKEKSPPIKRYYRHDLVDSQSNDDDDDVSDSDSEMKKSNMTSKMNSSESTNKSLISNFSNQSCSTSKSMIKPQERLKRLMKAQIDKQYKLDKKAENDRLERLKLEQRERNREFDKLSRRNRRTRSRSKDSSSDSESDSSYDKRKRYYSRSESRTPPSRFSRHYREHRRRSYRSRSKSPSYERHNWSRDYHHSSRRR